MRTLALISTLLAVGYVAADFGNDPPVPARKPVWYTGHWDTGIEIEIVYDLLCSDSARLDPIFQQFLNQPFDNSTGDNTPVREKIQLSYTFLPLPYHHKVWIPHLIVPYLLDVCHATPDKCQFYQYTSFCFQNQDVLLNAKDSSQDDLIKSWTKLVSDKLSLNQNDLLALYNPDTDKHNSEMRTRYMYKYNAHHHVSGTPFAIVNGIILQNFPETVADWTDMLKTVWAQTSTGNYYA